MATLRELFLLDPQVVYLNHGSFGATPEPVFREYQRWQRELEQQPTEFLGRRHAGLMKQARAALAGYMGARAEDLVFTQNATIAVNIVARSLELASGDEVLASDHEYGACDRIWRFLSSKTDFSYVKRPILVPLASAGDLAEDFWAGVTTRTRVIFLSHITSPTAIILPVAEICRRARAAGILTVVDGAHAPGQVALNLAALGADFYAGNLHKWLCAPKGAGFLHASANVQHLVEPLVVSWGYESAAPSASPFIDEQEWWGTRDLAAFLAVPAAIEFQATHRWEQVRAHCHRLLQDGLKNLVQVTGMPTFYPNDTWYGQMASAPLPSELDIVALQARLYDEYGVEVPLLAWNGRKLIRVSVQGYNSPDDLARLVAAMKAVI